MTSSPAPDPRRWAGLFVLLVASFMNLIDVTIVNVALPSLQKNLAASDSQIEWVVAGYLLAFAVGLLPFGRLGDRIGRRKMFLVGVAAFTLFSALCGLAPTIDILILARMLQGLGGAMMMPQVLAITQVSFPPAERGFAFSLFGLTAGLAAVTGPLAGGLLIDANMFGLDWRPIFLVNIPIGIGALVAARLVIKPLPGHPHLTNDAGGIMLAAASVFLLVFALIEGRGFGWPAWIFGLIVVAVAGLASFYLYERRRAANGRAQLLPVKLLENGNYLLGAMTTLVFFSGIAGLFMVLAVFLQAGFGFTALQSGLITVPFPIGVLLVSFANGRLGNRWLRPRVALGALVLAAGMVLLRLSLAEAGDSVERMTLFLPLFVAGLGMGIAVTSLFQTVLAGIPNEDAGSGSGALQSFQQVGGSLGVALIGEIFFSTLTQRFSAGSTPHAAFLSSIEAALIYEIAVFVLVAAMVLFMKAQHPQAAGGGRPEARVTAIAEG